jgi:adhesin transport system outer membrane protein
VDREKFEAASRLLIAAAMLWGLGVQRTHAETLREAVDLAVRTNPQALEAQNRRFAADEGVKVARGGYFPRVELSSGIGREHLNDAYSRSMGMSNDTFTRRQASATLTQMIFDGFGVRSAVEQQRAQVRSSAYQVAATADDLALRVTAAYLEVLRRSETVVAARENFNAHQLLYQQIKRRSDSGVGRGADLVQAQARVASAMDTLRSEEGALQDAEFEYVRLVGTRPKALVKPTYPAAELPRTQKIAVDQALFVHPTIKIAEADVDAARAQKSEAQAAFYPRFEIELGANHDNDRIRGLADDQSVMLRVRYNLFQGGSDRARVQQAAFRVRESAEAVNRVRQQVEQDTSTAFNDNQTARERLVALTEYVESSAATREAYAKQFHIGQRALLDLLNSENEYYNARVSFITGYYAELMTAYRVFSAIGRLLTVLDIAPPQASRP